MAATFNIVAFSNFIVFTLFIYSNDIKYCYFQQLYEYYTIHLQKVFHVQLCVDGSFKWMY
jgi:hypothetical protein